MKITKNQNRFAWWVAFLIALFVVSLLVSGIASAKTLVEQINSIRETPLKEDKQLNKIAVDRCVKMQAFSHDEFWTDYNWRILAKGYKYRGENLYNLISSPGQYTLDQIAFEAFLNSPTHKSNMLDKNFTKIGVSICDNKTMGKVVVALFAGK